MTDPQSSSATNIQSRAAGRFRGHLHGGLSFVRRTIGCVCWILVVVGLVLRWTVQDRYHPWAMIYYLTPIAAVPIWLLIAGLMSGRSISRPNRGPHISLARINLVAIVISTLWTLQSEHINRAQPPSPHDVKVVFWNTARIPFGLDGPARQIFQREPTLIGLVEASDYKPEFVERWRRQLPGYEVAGTHFGGLIAVKGSVINQISYDLLPNSACEQFDLIINGKNVTLLLVDISSQLNLSRQNPLQELADLCERLSDRPLIVMGDFNTPDDSVLFDPVRIHCRNAVRQRGKGYAPSWPVPLPVLTLDQVWVNTHVQVSSCEYGWSRYSDHRPAISEISFGNHQ